MMKNKFLRIIAILALLAMLAVAVVACSDNKPEESGAQSSDEVSDSSVETPEGEDSSETTEEPADKVQNKGDNPDDLWGETTPV